MADCETDSGVETTVTEVSGAGFETESEAKDAKLEALRPQIEQDRTTKGKTCSTRTCQGTSDCRLAFLIQSERDAHLYSYIDGAGKARWGYNVPAGATYNTGCKCVPRAGGGMKKARQGGKKKGRQAGGKKTVRRKTAKSAR